jgi:hypothetical protein
VEEMTPPSSASQLDGCQQRRDRPRGTPRPHCDICDLVSCEIQGGKGDLLVFQDCAGRLVVVVLGIKGGEQDARVEEQRLHGPGRVAFTCSAARPPWGDASPSNDRIAAARPSRRLRSAASAKSLITALRVVPPRRASASTSARRSSGRETMTFAMSKVYPGIPTTSRSTNWGTETHGAQGSSR